MKLCVNLIIVNCAKMSEGLENIVGMSCILTLPRKPKTLLLCHFLLLFAKISKIPLEKFVLKIHL